MPALGYPGADESVEEVDAEEDGRHDPGEAEQGDSGKGKDGDGRHRTFGGEVDVLEAGVHDAAHHEDGDADHDDGEEVFPESEVDFRAVQVDDEVHRGDDGSGGHGYGQSDEVGRLSFLFGGGGHAVEPCEAQPGAEEVEGGNAPADPGLRDAEEDGFGEEQGGCDTEGDDVGEGVEFPAEGAFLAAHAGYAPVEEVEDAGGKDEVGGLLVGFVGGLELVDGVLGAGDHPLEDGHDGEESAEEVARGEKIRQEGNLGLVRYDGLLHGFRRFLIGGRGAFPGRVEFAPPAEEVVLLENHGLGGGIGKGLTGCPVRSRSASLVCSSSSFAAGHGSQGLEEFAGLEAFLLCYRAAIGAQ